jgi:hypothetical protein
MSAMSIRLPESLHRNARAYAEREGVSVNQLVATALAEKLAALGAEDSLRERAARGSREKFAQALALVPDGARWRATRRRRIRQRVDDGRARLQHSEAGPRPRASPRRTATDLYAASPANGRGF